MGHLDDRANLNGKLAVIAGGAGGLGRACTLELGRAGMALGVCDRDPARLDELNHTLSHQGIRSHTAVVDVRDAEALAGFFAETDDVLGGRLDVLVNAVGGTFRQPFEASNPRGWEALYRANFAWLLQSVQLAIPRMRAAGGGSIINLTSVEAHRAAPNYAVYAAMKAAVASFGRTLAIELAPDRIRVNAIAPDFVPTEGLTGALGAGLATGDLSDQIAIPLGRKGTYDDVGGCALFLASDLSAFVTGQTLHPDGGVMAASGWFHWPGDGWLPGPPQAIVESLTASGSSDSGSVVDGGAADGRAGDGQAGDGRAGDGRAGGG